MYFIKININSFIFPHDLFSNSRNRHLLRFIENIIIILRYVSRMFREFFRVISLSLMASVRLWPHLDNLSFSKLVVSLLKDHFDLCSKLLQSVSGMTSVNANYRYNIYSIIALYASIQAQIAVPDANHKTALCPHYNIYHSDFDSSASEMRTCFCYCCCYCCHILTIIYFCTNSDKRGNPHFLTLTMAARW